MKLKYEFVVREIAGDFVLVPMGKAALKLSGMISTNAVGAFLWEQLLEENSEERLAGKLVEAFDVDIITAENDVKEFLEQLQKLDLVE